MTQSPATARRDAPTIVPAFETGSDLLALVPKSALSARHIDIVVVGRRSGTAAVAEELKAASSQIGSAPKAAHHKSGSFGLQEAKETSVGHLHSLLHADVPAAALSALLSRFARALTRAVGVAGDEFVHRALERPSDVGAVIDLLRSALPLLSAERELDPELATHVAALAAEDDLIRRAGGLRDSKWVAEYLAISPKSVTAKARRNELLAITRGDRNLYPAFQFQDGRVIAGLREVLQALALTNGWSRLCFLLTPDPGLDDRTPLDAIGADREAVLALAAEADMQGAA